jgi:hypothetical protein
VQRGLSALLPTPPWRTSTWKASFTQGSPEGIAVDAGGVGRPLLRAKRTLNSKLVFRKERALDRGHWHRDPCHSVVSTVFIFEGPLCE